MAAENRIDLIRRDDSGRIVSRVNCPEPMAQEYERQGFEREGVYAARAEFTDVWRADDEEVC